MINGRKNSLKFCALLLVTILGITLNVNANYADKGFFCISLTADQDTTRPTKKDTIPTRDSVIVKSDTFGLQISKDSLDSPIAYSASDSIVLDVPNQKIIMFSKANVKKDDMDLSADSIEFDQATQMIVATFRTDSAGGKTGRPRMIQGESTMDSDLIQFNMKTQKGITRNTFTQQGEMYVTGEKIKKISPNEYFALRGQFTTCNLDVPHFAFRTRRMKLVNQKLAVSGPIHPEFEGVPVPVYLPFGFFPLSQGRHSGLLPPQFTASDQFGIGLTGLGYYKVLNDYFDVTLTSDIYSYGGWALYLRPTYRVRYRYTGTLSLALQKTRLLSEDPKRQFTTAQTFNITWSHMVDAKARPGTTFQANVNAGSTRYNQFVTNNPIRNYSNQLTSTVMYSKTWEGYNLTVAANHNQNNNTRLVNMNLPNVGFTINTFYPLQGKEFVGTPKWYQKLGIGLNSAFSNQLSFYDTAFSLSRIIDTLQWGAQHNVPIQLPLPPFGPLQVAPGISFQEKWYSRKLIRSWNDNRQKVDTTINKGFFSSREVSFSLGVSTALFGTFDRFGPRSAIRAIRHVIRPTVSANYKPNLTAKDFYNTQIDSSGRQFRFSYFDGSIYGPFSEGTFGGISFGIDNNIEMKVRDRKDTTGKGERKVRLIDGFGINGSYNFLADSFALTPLSLYLRSTLFEKVNITMGASLDPYQVDSAGYRLDRYSWQGNSFSLGRLTTGNIAISTSFRSKPRDEGKARQEEQQREGLPPMTMEEQMAVMEFVRQNPAEFADFNIPWSLNLSYSLSFYRDFRPDYKGFITEVNSNLSLNGDFNLTPKWKMGMNAYYDFKTSSIQMATMYISREMHCWQLSINVTPIGIMRSFNITINPKSGILQDLRVNRSRYFYNG